MAAAQACSEIESADIAAPPLAHTHVYATQASYDGNVWGVWIGAHARVYSAEYGTLGVAIEAPRERGSYSHA